MAKYVFPQFNFTIENPFIEIDYTNIIDNAIDNLLTITFSIKTSNMSSHTKAEMLGISLDNIPYDGTWENGDLLGLLETRLNDFMVED